MLTYHADPCRHCGGTDRYIKSNRCASCARTSAKRWSRTEGRRSVQRRYNATHPRRSAVREAGKRYDASDRGRVKRKQKHYKQYGVTLEVIEHLRFLQNNICQICGAPDPAHLDHDHETNRIRAWLCPDCNKGIGFMKDDPKRLRRAADYVEFFKAYHAKSIK